MRFVAILDDFQRPKYTIAIAVEKKIYAEMWGLGVTVPGDSAQLG